MFKKRSEKYLSKDSSPLEDLLPKQKNTLKPFSENLHKIKQRMKEIFGDTADLIIEDIQIGQRKGLLCYLTTMTDWQAVTSKVLDPITNTAVKKDNITSESDWKNFGTETFSGSQHNFIEFEQQTIENIINGYGCVFVEGMKLVLSIQIQASGKRAIEEPSTQTVVRGPKDGFNEDIETNISLIRKKIKNPALRFQSYTIGKETSTRVYLAYVDGIINTKILEEIRKRIGDVKTNALFDSGILEEFVEDKPFSLFPLVYNSERPDVIAAHLISGKFALFVDGSPFILTAPTTFSDFLSMSEDYYQPFMMGSFIRLIRYFSFLLALLLPSLYVAVITFHYEMIPTQLLISIVSQREEIPFPAVIEALIMEITFEILREAGVRMPRAVGGTISIVGGLVIGQAAVEAGVVSPIMVIIVALTAIASFVSPVYAFAFSTRLLRFGFIIIAALLGLYGVFLGLIVLVAHLTSLRSFSVPYLAPIAPFSLQDQGDTFIRLPAWAIKKRPSYLRTKSPSKQSNSKSPSPPGKRSDNQ